MKKLLSDFFKKRFHIFLLITFLQIFCNLLSVATPLSYQYLIDNILNNKQYDKLMQYVIFILLVFFGYVLFEIISKKMIIKEMNNLEKEIKEALFKKIVLSESKHLQKFSKGEIITRVLNDVNSLINIVSEYLFSTVMSFLTYLIVIIAIFRFNLYLGLVCLLSTPGYFILSNYFGKSIKKLNISLKKDSEGFLNILDESIDGRDTIKLYDCFKYQHDRFSLKLQSLLKNKKRLMTKSFISKQSFLTLSLLFPLMILLIGVYLIIKEQLTLGVLITVLSCLNYILAPSTTISKALIGIREYRVSFNRLKELLDIEEEYNNNAVTKRQHDGYIVFENVGFNYSNKKIFNNLSLNISKNEFICIVGKNGSGKSTFTKLLCGLIAPSNGNIYINGLLLDKYNLNKIRSLFSIAMQNDFIFTDTIDNNINPNNIQYSNLEVLNSIIDGNLRKKVYNKNNLSGGETKRVTLARALHKDAEILIIDETSSNIDIDTNRIIKDILKNLKNKKTIFIIDHYLNCLDLSDRVIFIESPDKIILDTHINLYKSNELYRKLYKEFVDKDMSILESDISGTKEFVG